MHWAALNGSLKHGSRNHGPHRGERSSRGHWGVRLGVAAGLVGSLLGSGCSFNLPARTICTTGDCTGDLGTPVDMAKDPADPNLPGAFQVATVSINPTQPQLATGQLFLPSDDRATLSTRQNKYPLVLFAPAQYLDTQQLAPYAQRLASHGIVVALYRPLTESDQAAYRQTGIDLISYLLGGTEPAVTTRIDETHIGLAGYNLGAQVSVTIATRMQMLRGLFLLDPQVVVGLTNPVNGLTEMAAVALAKSQPVLMLGEQVSKTGKPGYLPCTPATTNYEQYFAVSPTGTIAVNFVNAAHPDFVDTHFDSTCQSGTMAKAETQRLAIKYMTAYFQWSLLERTSAQSYLTGTGFDADARQYTIMRTIK